MQIRTTDKHQIAFDHLKTGHEKLVVLAHGFYNNKEAYLFKKMAEAFSEHFDVMSFDFRGHGKSSGLFSWTVRETLDLRAVIAYAKEKGYSSIGVIGFSLGGAVALIEASQNQDIHSVISVAAPYDFWKIDFRFWEEEMLNDLKLNLGIKGKGKFIRPGNPFIEKVRPVDVVRKISPRPVLFIHGSEDWLIRPYHTAKLYRQAESPKKKILWRHAGHAEKIFDSDPKKFMQVCNEWFEATLSQQESNNKR